MLLLTIIILGFLVILIILGTFIDTKWRQKKGRYPFSLLRDDQHVDPLAPKTFWRVFIGNLINVFTFWV